MGFPELIGTVLLSGTGGAVINTGIQNLLNRRKLGADADKVEVDAADVITRTALAMVEPLGRRIQELEAEVETLRGKVRETTQELDTCRAESRAKDNRIRELEQRDRPTTGTGRGTR